MICFDDGFANLIEISEFTENFNSSVLDQAKKNEILRNIEEFGINCAINTGVQSGTIQNTESRGIFHYKNCNLFAFVGQDDLSISLGNEQEYKFKIKYKKPFQDFRTFEEFKEVCEEYGAVEEGTRCVIS